MSITWEVQDWVPSARATMSKQNWTKWMITHHTSNIQSRHLTLPFVTTAEAEAPNEETEAVQATRLLAWLTLSRTVMEWAPLLQVPFTLAATTSTVTIT